MYDCMSDHIYRYISHIFSFFFYCSDLSCFCCCCCAVLARTVGMLSNIPADDKNVCVEMPTHRTIPALIPSHSINNLICVPIVPIC